MLQDHEEISHAMDVAVHVEMTAKRVNTAVNTMKSPSNSVKKKQKKRVESKCRDEETSSDASQWQHRLSKVLSYVSTQTVLEEQLATPQPSTETRMAQETSPL
ncbi:hypothetical protein [Parasitella parasitica]|uniref:Uncharacterized protein n=1 Tax=Parasitella parasitica TaxID=35722 RepID=A0A0B7N3K1_9FUNG|nr:hypothetical protein [Parasitella parasitica]